MNNEEKLKILPAVSFPKIVDSDNSSCDKRPVGSATFAGEETK